MWQIRYIQHHEINIQKWDECIKDSPGGLLYAYSWFLNIMSPGWDALVLNDYEAVMPLTHRKKWGIRYLFQPAFCAELGVFSRVEMSAALVNDFLNNIPAHFRFIDICLNRNNNFSIERYPFRTRNNYLLSLEPTYENLYKKYSVNHKRNVKKAVSLGLSFHWEINIEDAVSIARDALRNIDSLPDQDWADFIRLFRKAKLSQSAICAGVFNKEGDLLSAAVFIYACGCWYYLLAGSTANGRKTGAAHFLIDQFVKKYAETGDVLDFEGSDVPSVAAFYRGFGSSEIYYPALRQNRLPFLIRWLK